MTKRLPKLPKKSLLIVIVIVIVLALCFLAGSFLLVKITTQPLSLPKVASKPAPTLAPKQVEILYNGLTFNPKSVTIKLGDSLTVKNQSTKNMEIAVGIHPSHQELKGFEEKVVKKGEDYTFTIEEKGQFEYHDHLHPKVLGLITVN